MKIQRQTVIDSTGEQLELLPVGTRVCHTKNRRLTGTIVAWEYHESGSVSPLPYKVYWDDSQLAHKVIGFMSIYPMRSEVQPISGRK